MNLLSAKSILDHLKGWLDWGLRKRGYKIVKLEDYIEEEVEVDFNYPTESSKCTEAKKKGANFTWSETYNSNYERYYEIDNNIRRKFKCRNLYLWIKK
jgi:hypothetical protein